MIGRIIRVRGQVQGVGFRPFVWQLATRMGLTGEVLNDAEGVLIRVSGPDLDAFEAAVRVGGPPLARIDSLESLTGPVPDTGGFTIAPSGERGARTRVTPDAATCGACRDEIADPGARRHGYAFTNCTQCGPRFTIITGLPYDRAQTTMAAFSMCAACRAEYENPADRRFHAQPIACPDCGPRLWFERGGSDQGGDPIAQAVQLLRAGGILAIKGLGGFHLACNATDAAAVATLRQRKHRPGKPFALMARRAVIGRHATLSDAAAGLLADVAAPIVLIARAGVPLPDEVAPGLAHLGWMLPHTPLHHLICDAVDMPLIMTSGNLTNEPQATDNGEARARLGSIADGFLMHDRAIARRLDDGVERIGHLGRTVLRRGRGRVPGTIALPARFRDAPEVVAYGGQMKSAICLVKDGRALLSHHLGDLDHPRTVAEFSKADQDYAALFDHRPQIVAVDLHPGFHATRHGLERAMTEGLHLVEVQHHHAHMAAALGEAGWHGDCAVGIVLDGLGLGPEGAIWGGEVLVGGYAQVIHAGGLAPALLVGGDRAQSEPWRNAVVRLDAAGLAGLADALFVDHPVAALRRAAASGVGSVPSSSAGRLFDAVAACLGLAAARQSHEAEAAMRLEALAAAARHETGAYGFAASGGQLDPAPLFQALAQDLAAGAPRPVIAARFHRGLARAFANLASGAADRAGTRTIALSGGCFQNAILLDMTVEALAGYRLCLPGDVPANDGGLAYGQALVALAQSGFWV